MRAETNLGEFIIRTGKRNMLQSQETKNNLPQPTWLDKNKAHKSTLTE